MATTSYAIALGSNRRHGRHGAPTQVVRAGVVALAGVGTVEALSTIRATPALGPAGRGFANAAALLSTDLAPDDLLAMTKLRAVFDPEQRANPHKIFPDAKVCVETRAPRRQVPI